MSEEFSEREEEPQSQILIPFAFRYISIRPLFIFRQIDARELSLFVRPRPSFSRRLMTCRKDLISVTGSLPVILAYPDYVG